jgi:hypothetical protein
VKTRLILVLRRERDSNRIRTLIQRNLLILGSDTKAKNAILAHNPYTMDTNWTQIRAISEREGALWSTRKILLPGIP